MTRATTKGHAMPRLRFATAQDLYEAYPTARSDIGVAANAAPSLDFLAALSSGDALKAALSFCAYLLPRREAVAWGCQCLRQWSGLNASDEARLAASEAWVREPEERNRRRALDLAERSDIKDASTWIAFAAGRAGGQISIDGEHFTPMPQYATAQAVRIALILAGAAGSFEARAEIQRRWLELGLRIAVE
ncbi:hypothetical protein CR492_09550 [Methylocella silvestris]|uniref:Uncharacterized protein n=2 Tax=Methylocella silvestris TaxID=199596 RepID=A0A2J7TH38_METSI|nr:hypothetical protein CR492_09550 [Methylocella silvestris]